MRPCEWRTGKIDEMSILCSAASHCRTASQERERKAIVMHVFGRQQGVVIRNEHVTCISSDSCFLTPAHNELDFIPTLYYTLSTNTQSCQPDLHYILKLIILRVPRQSALSLCTNISTAINNTRWHDRSTRHLRNFGMVVIPCFWLIIDHVLMMITR